MPITRRGLGRTAAAGSAAISSAALAAAPALAANATPVFAVPATTSRSSGSDAALPGAAHLLHRPQLRGARARDGLRPDPRAAVLLPEADRRDPDVAPGTTADHPYPTLTKNYHYEVELVAALAEGGRNIPVEQALDLVYGYAVGLDMTRRDLQRAMGDEKKPWEIGKSFDRSAPIGPLHRVATTGHFTKGAIWLKVNGAVKQNANLNQMIWIVAEQISKLSAGVRADARRHHLFRHAGECRPGRERRRDALHDRRAAGPVGADRLSAGRGAPRAPAGVTPGRYPPGSPAAAARAPSPRPSACRS